MCVRISVIVCVCVCVWAHKRVCVCASFIYSHHMHTTLPLSGLLPPRTSSDGVWQLGWWAEAVCRQMKSDESSDESINGVYVSATAIMVLCLFNAGVEAAPGQVG